MIEEAVEKLRTLCDLTPEEMAEVMEEIMSGKAKTDEIVSFLNELSKKGETVDELTSAVKVMRLHATKIDTRQPVILDTCGTGGDTKGTFNISTVVAFVASGSGIVVAKHGNRAVSSCCGSADTLEALGVNINMTPQELNDCLQKIGIAFLFAQKLHPAMKYAMEARKSIGKRTMFNILGPLSNPAAATHQLVGVYDRSWVLRLAEVLRNLGTRHALVVHGNDGLDEISTASPTFVAEVKPEGNINYEIKPEDFGIKRAGKDDLNGGSVSDNAMILLDILNGARGPKRDIVVLNAAAAIFAADRARSIKEGIAMAEDSLDSKKALEKLELLKKVSKKE
ncbi:MAG: anthranilate phosphoribosyltransferase [Candidatus Omnitrophica bacterium]|nr:anthranilate phosphoribosyltransferase [Candidatus Omnitrophota bacterium]